MTPGWPTAGPATSRPTSSASRSSCSSTKDYADPTAHLANATNVEWLHPLSDIVGGLIDAGLALDWLHEHAQVPWRMFEMLVQKDDGDWHWPDKQWLPLAVSLQARHPS